MTINNFVQVNQDQCTQCGLCVQVCRRTLSMGEHGPVANDFCIACGHCVAVCPNGALDHSMAPEYCQYDTQLPGPGYMPSSLPQRSDWAPADPDCLNIAPQQNMSLYYSFYSFLKIKVLPVHLLQDIRFSHLSGL